MFLNCSLCMLMLAVLFGVLLYVASFLYNLTFRPTYRIHNRIQFMTTVCIYLNNGINKHNIGIIMNLL